MTLGKVGVVVAARTASSRLPGKALLPFGDLPMILFLLRRLCMLRDAQVVVATTTLDSDNELATLVEQSGVSVFRGDAKDLVQRYCDVAQHFGFDTVVRITADCPFVDSELVNWCLCWAAKSSNWDLATTKGQFPVGLDAEVYRADLMRDLNDAQELTEDEREHLTLRLYDNKYKLLRISPPMEWPASSKTFTVDTQSDYERNLGIVKTFKGGNFALKNLLSR